MCKVDKATKEDNRMYGDYGKSVEARAAIIEILASLYSSNTNDRAMPIEQMVVLSDTVNELVKIASALAPHEPWVNIADCANSVLKILQEERIND